MRIVVAMMVGLFFAPSAMAQAGMTAEQMKMIQKYQNMDPAQMQELMASAQQAAKCMGNIDQSKMQQLQSRGEAITAKIKSFCAAGKEKKAERYAMKEGKKMMSDPTIKKLQKCSKKMVAQFNFAPQMGANGERKSICQ